MSRSLPRIFIPGLLAMVVGMFGDRILALTHSSMPRIYWIGPSVHPDMRGFIAIEPLLLAFFLVGGFMAAALSRAFGASVGQRLLAAELPALVTGTLLVVSCGTTLLGGLLMKSWHLDVVQMLSALLGYAVGWVLLPGVALYVGALPFLRVQPARAAA